MMKISIMTVAFFTFAPAAEVSGKTCTPQSASQNTANPTPKLVSYDDCMAQVRSECEGNARQRKLIDAAKDTFMKRCLSEASGK
jgi:hypothetical protein